MNKEFEERYHLLESTHFWFKCRRDFIVSIVKNLYKSGGHVLDVGCASGHLLEALQALPGAVSVGIDVSEEAKRICDAKGFKMHLADVTNEMDMWYTFDCIIASDVLEHILDDEKAVLNFENMLTKNGRLIIFVPAFNFLWSYHDIQNKHCRRYSKKQLEDILKRAGFIIERSSYWNSFLFFPVLLLRVLKKIIGKKSDDLSPLPRLLNTFFGKILALENLLLLKGVNLPIGLSVFCIARKQ